MRNEAAWIERCIQSLLAQDYPGRIEILVADGGSTDGSVAIVDALLGDRRDARLLPNPRKTQAAGWNLGIDAANGDVVGIVSGHAWLAPDYVSRAVDALRRTGADMVGGPVQPIAEDTHGVAIGLAGRSRFGVGGARFRYSEREERVDTVYMGVCRRELYQRMRFDETMVRNQDDELSYRLLDEGGVIVCDPSIRSWYVNRSRIRDLWTQYYAYGFWKVRVLTRHPRQTRPRHLVPAALVTAVAGPLLLAPLRRDALRVSLAAAGTYLAANVAAATRTGRRVDRPDLIPAIAAAFATMHVAYGTGMLLGALRAIGAAARRR